MASTTTANHFSVASKLCRRKSPKPKASFRYRLSTSIVCKQMTKGNMWPFGSRRDDVADFYGFISHDDAVNEKFYQLSSLGKACMVEHRTNLRTEGLKRS